MSIELGSIIERAFGANKPRTRSRELTLKETAVLRLHVVENLTYKAIAAEVKRSQKTVEKHICNIYAKMGPDGIHNQLGLFHWAVRKHYVSLEEVFPSVPISAIRG